MRKWFAIFILIMLIPVAGCSTADPVTEDVYFKGDVRVWNGDSWITLNDTPVAADLIVDGKVNFVLPAYANNAAAIAGGLVAGDLYRTNGDPDLLCIVH